MNQTTPLAPLAMVIEDDEKLLMIYSAALRQAGFTVRTVKRGDLAMDELKAYRPKLVVLDLQLPYVPGTVILQAIRTDLDLIHTRVIVASSDYVMAQSLEEEGDLVLIKPVSFSQLRDLALRFIRS
jgi:DNA-binding response OmpR family regulator